jgi:hypothetical protein
MKQRRAAPKPTLRSVPDAWLERRSKPRLIVTGLYFQWTGRFFGPDAMRLVNGLPWGPPSFWQSNLDFMNENNGTTNHSAQNPAA